MSENMSGFKNVFKLTEDFNQVGQFDYTLSSY